MSIINLNKYKNKEIRNTLEWDLVRNNDQKYTLST